MLMTIKKLVFVILLGMALTLVSCKEDVVEMPQNPNLVKEAIYESMQEWYYWNDQLPVSPGCKSLPQQR